MEKLVNILASMSSEVQGFVAGAVVDKEEGLTIAEYKADPELRGCDNRGLQR